jgi:hypothetical protein
VKIKQLIISSILFGIILTGCTHNGYSQAERQAYKKKEQ